MGNYTVAVIDSETTGLSPHYGDRTIEVGAVLVSDNQIVDRFQSLMNHHRALADAEMTVHLWMGLIDDIKMVFGRNDVPFGLMQQLGKTPKKKVAEFLATGKM